MTGVCCPSMNQSDRVVTIPLILNNKNNNDFKLKVAIAEKLRRIHKRSYLHIQVEEI